MAIIPQISLFVWDEIEKLGDLERLNLVIQHMPDEELMRALEMERGKGRNDYPVRAIWNSILAGVVYQHPSVESLRRELLRNGQLRFMCGFRSDKDVPGAYVYTRFFKKLFEKEEMIEDIFNHLVDELEGLLPEFGKNLAIDGKAIQSLARRKNKKKKKDGRRDLDANWGIKEYKGVREDGTCWSKIVKWFGYKLHLIVDADYELPAVFEVTKAQLIEKLDKTHPQLIEDGNVRSG